MARVLVIGGSSGLGLELATRRVAMGDVVHITGRQDPEIAELQFHKLVLDTPDSAATFEELYKTTGHIDILILSAGFYQAGKLDELSVADIEKMIDVGARSLIYAVRALLFAQKTVGELMIITSTSQFTARANESVYNFVKAGAGLFARAMADDGRIAKVLLVAPGGMDTRFWRDTKVDTAALLDPAWVADQIQKAEEGEYRYRFIKIFREPRKVEEVDTI